MDINLNRLLDLLAERGGRIVCTGQLTAFQIAEARKLNRFWVREDGIGFAWLDEGLRIKEDYLNG